VKKFIIIGGGICGLTTAYALIQKGFSAEVYESYPALKPAGAGIILAPNALKAYAYLGIDQVIRQQGHEVSSLKILSDTGKLLSDLSSENHSLLALHRGDLSQALAALLPEGTIHLGKKCVDFRQDANGVQVDFADGSSAHGDYLIAADGIHSPIRKKLLPTVPLRYAGYTCWRGVVKVRGKFDYLLTESTETWGRKGRFGIVPLSKDRIYWFAVVNAAENDPQIRKYGKEELLQYFADYHQPIYQVIEATEEKDIIWNNLSDLTPLSQYAYDRVLLMGDAAHAMTPNMGQGACQAIEDAAILAMCLKKSSSVGQAFKKFEKLRVKRVRKIVDRSWSMGKVGQLQNGFVCKLRNWLFSLMPAKLSQQQMAWIYQFEYDD
jgi:2-polyprenyl-6-methoxyphenol hydroxylase-like FAD-dependent oxidoreductase